VYVLLQHLPVSPDPLFQVLAGDSDIGDRLPIPTDTMQLFDETRGNYTRPAG
jgi:hypothetical protein